MIRVEPLTRDAFAPFGEVIETAGAHEMSINQGHTTRFDRLSSTDPGPGGAIVLSIFRGRRWLRPLWIAMLERHPLGSQSFIPLANHDWLVVVARAPVPEEVCVFRARGDQGVTYARGVWHHPLLVLKDDHDFLVVDRAGPGDNLEEKTFARPVSAGDL